jgi:hypothetical protein
MGAIIVCVVQGLGILARCLPCLYQIALIVTISWSRTIYGQFELLAGKSASHDFLQLIVYNTMMFSEEIEKVDTVRAYHVRIVDLLVWIALLIY